MKRIYIDDKVHEQLKEEAKREGRTLQWVVLQRLSNTREDYLVRRPQVGDIRPEPTVTPDSQEYDPLQEMIDNGIVKKGV